jgi:hypothetical protein
MSSALLLSVLVAFTPAIGVALQDKDKDREIRKGDTITVRGCLNGGALEATDIEGENGAQGAPIGLTFRLTGDKKVTKQLRDEHGGRIVSVKGVLKSDLRSEGGQTARVGGVRIGIGVPSSQPGRPCSR